MDSFRRVSPSAGREMQGREVGETEGKLQDTFVRAKKGREYSEHLRRTLSGPNHD